MSPHTCWEEALVDDEVLCCGAAGEDGRELEAVDGLPLSLLLEDLEESEKETLWFGESRLPSDVLGRCHKFRCDMVAALAVGGGVFALRYLGRLRN